MRPRQNMIGFLSVSVCERAPVRAMTGTELIHASPMPVSRLVVPGPSAPDTTPGL